MDENYLKSRVQEELVALKSDLKLKQSSAELELLPFVLEAIDYCEQ